MIPKNKRVPREKIPQILKKGKSVNSKLFIIRYWKNYEKMSRFRTIVSMKIDKKAVKRNKLRRRIYEAIRTNLQETQPPENLDMILIPKKQITKAKYQEIKDDILTLFHGEIK